MHAGYRVYYTTAADLVARTSRAAMDGRWANTMRFWAGPQVLIVDELGYLPMPGEAASHLFQVISRRYKHGSIILTTNRGIADWGHIFEDTTVATAVLTGSFTTPACSRSTGDSYRMRHHRDAIARSDPHSPAAHRVRNPRDHTWGILMILDSRSARSSRWMTVPRFPRSSRVMSLRER